MKKIACLNLALGLMASLVWTASVEALDVITRKSATNRLSGTVTAVTKSEVTLKPQTGADVKIPINDIALIEWDSAPVALRTGLSQENNGNLEEAIKTFQGALDAAPANATYIRVDLQYYIARSLAKLALADATRLPEATTRLKSFTDTNVDSLRYFEAMGYLGQLYMAAGDYANAEASFTAIERAPFEDMKLSAQASKAQVLLAQGQVDQALQAFDTILKVDVKDAAAKQSQLEAMLGKAAGLNVKNQYEESLKLLAEVVAKADESDARLQAGAQVQKGTSLLGLGKSQEALMAYLLVDVLFSGQQEAHAESLYNLSKLWPVVGQPGRAEEARASLETKYPNSPWTKKLSGN